MVIVKNVGPRMPNKRSVRVDKSMGPSPFPYLTKPASGARPFKERLN